MRRAFVSFAVLLFGCRGERDLPDEFLLGASVAGFQVEMGCPSVPAERCEDRNSDWYAFITSTVAVSKATNFLRGDPPSRGPGYYELWPQDFERLASELSLGGLRFSIEWSRIFPESTVGISDHQALLARASTEALDYYRRQLADLKKRGIVPIVTLHHYTLPRWIHDAVGCNKNLDTCSPRGWLEPTIVAEIAKYAGFVAREFGRDIDIWVTLNEPMAVVLPGYLFPSPTRTNPPAQFTRYEEARAVLTRMIEAHARMVDAVRENDRSDADGDGTNALLGLVHPITPVLAKDPSVFLDRKAAKNTLYLLNEVIWNGVLKGELDHDLDGQAEVRADLVGRSDFIGANYYGAAIVAGDEDAFAPQFSRLLTLKPLELKQDEQYPRGIYDMLLWLKERYPDHPIYITENGTYPESGDQERYLVEHMQWVLRARERDEVDVRAYFWWSLLDNYEWNHGMSLRFGLYEVAVDDPMKTRTQRTVAKTFARIAKERSVPDDLAERFPIDP